MTLAMQVEDYDTYDTSEHKKGSFEFVRNRGMTLVRLFWNCLNHYSPGVLRPYLYVLVHAYILLLQLAFVYVVSGGRAKVDGGFYFYFYFCFYFYFFL